MNGYSSHTYLRVNAQGERFWVKYPFKTDQGIDFLTQEDAGRRHARRKCVRPGLCAHSKGGPRADGKRCLEVDVWKASGEFIRSAYTLRAEDDDWGQPGTMVRKVLDDAACDRRVPSIVGHLQKGVSQPVLERTYEYWRNVDKELCDRLARDLGGS